LIEKMKSSMQKKPAQTYMKKTSFWMKKKFMGL